MRDQTLSSISSRFLHAYNWPGDRPTSRGSRRWGEGSIGKSYLPFSKILFFSRYALCRSAISTDIDKRKFEIPFLKGIFRSFKTNFPSLDSANSTETYSSPLLSDLWIHVSRNCSKQALSSRIRLAKAEEYRADPFDPIPAQTRKNATFIAFLNGSPWEGRAFFWFFVEQLAKLFPRNKLEKLRGELTNSIRMLIARLLLLLLSRKNGEFFGWKSSTPIVPSSPLLSPVRRNK